jgi:hypothetical protein
LNSLGQEIFKHSSCNETWSGVSFLACTT